MGTFALLLRGRFAIALSLHQHSERSGERFAPACSEHIAQVSRERFVPDFGCLGGFVRYAGEGIPQHLETGLTQH